MNNLDEDKNIKEALEEVELYQKGTLNLETWKYFKEELDLDEDIKLAKEVARELKLYVDGNKVRKGRAISTVVSELETYKKIADEIKELRNTIQKEYEYAMEGFLKKQIVTSVVDGTIAQETGWILNRIDEILNIGQ